MTVTLDVPATPELAPPTLAPPTLAPPAVVPAPAAPSAPGVPLSPEELLCECERVIGYTFRDRELLKRCLTHASMARTRLESNERLEFLGDAILGATICEILYHQFPADPEGELTRIKSVVVSRTTCATISRELGLERFLLVGKGLAGDQFVPHSLLAAVFESLIAGVYLDGGVDAARQWIARVMQPIILRTVDAGHGKNFKSLLQQHAQRYMGATPAYRLIEERGPDHSKFFKMQAVVGHSRFSPAWGPNKKEAEQRAAENAWHELHRLAIPHADGSEGQPESLDGAAVVPAELPGELPAELPAELPGVTPSIPLASLPLEADDDLPLTSDPDRTA